MSDLTLKWTRLFRRLAAGLLAFSCGGRIERRRRELTLEQREQELRTLLDASPGMSVSFHLRADGSICIPYVSPRIWEFFGLSPQDVVDDAQPLLALIHPDDVQRLRESGAQSARTMTPWHVEYRIVRPARGERWMEGHSNPQHHTDGGVVWHGFIHDITERKQAQTANLLESIFESPSRIYIYALDRSYRFLAFNEKFREAAKRAWRVDISVGMSMLDAVDTEAYREFCRNGFDRVLAGHSFSLESHEVMVKNGVTTNEFHENHGSPIRNHQGEIIGLTIFAVNITERKCMETELLAREQEFRTLVENAPEPIFRYAPDGRRIYVNAAVERIAGIPAPLLVGGASSDGKIISTHEGAAIVALVRRICETGEPGEIEVEHVDADGQRRYFHNRFAPELGADGEVKSVFSICHDITDRKHAEQRLKEALEFSNGVINAVPDTLFEVDREGRYLNVWMQNPNVQATQKSDLLSKTLYDVLSPENAATAMQAIAEADARGSSFSKAICVEQPGGESFWYEHSIAKKLGRAPSDATFLVLSRDVTKNMEAQQRLDETRKRLLSVLQTMPDMVWFKDAEGVYQLSNHAFSRLTGMTESYIFGRTDYDLFDTELADFFREQDLKAIEVGTIRLNEEWVNYADDGRRALLETRKVPVYGADGKVTGVLGIARDITERKEAELALRASEAHIQSRNELLQAIVESSPEIIIFALDTTYRYLAFNRKHRGTMQAIWGKDIGIGMNMLDVIGDHPDRLVAQTSMARALAGDSFVLEETYGSELLSRQHWLNHWAPIRSEAGDVVGLTCFVLNISERRIAEERLRRSRDIVRALAAHQETEREKERRRLAYEMHEDLAQNFAALRLHLASLEMGDADAKHSQVLKTMHSIADHGIARIRGMVSALRPAVLDLGLVSALQWLTDDFKGVGLDFVLTLQDGIVLSDAFNTFLYRATKEALLNVALHAAATQVTVSLVADDGVCCLVVHDNGCGFDPAALRGDGCFGLIGLSEGALHLGGELSIESSPDHGTTLEIRIVDV